MKGGLSKGHWSELKELPWPKLEQFEQQQQQLQQKVAMDNNPKHKNKYPGVHTI